MQSCLKKNFSHHILFDNKYAEQSYIAYLSKEKRKYIMNSSDYVERFIVFTIDFIFRINNAICRRGLVENNKEDIRKLYDTPKDVEKYSYYTKMTVNGVYNDIKRYKLTNEYEQEIFDMLEKVVNLKDKLFTNYDDFKSGIYELVKTIDDKHYTWTVGENIIYNRSIRDNERKKYYCAVIGQKGYKRFKTIYYNNVYLETRIKKITFEQVCDLLIVIADTYNELIIKEYDNASDIINDYLKNNTDMLSCKDIYYAKIFMDLKKISLLLQTDKQKDVVKLMKDIIQSENKKYKNDFLLYENIPIDENAIEQGQYIEL